MSAQKIEPRLMMRVGHTYAISSAVFNSAGSLVVTAAGDKTVKVWDIENGDLLFTLEGHTGHVNFAEFSPDGSLVVSAGDETAKIWDVRNGSLLHNLKGHEWTVNSAVFSPDGHLVVTASSDGTAKLWDVESGTLLSSLVGHTGSVYTALFSPDGNKVVTSCTKNTAKIWDVKSGALLSSLEGHEEELTSAIFSPDGSRVITTSYDGTAKLWDVESGALVNTMFVSTLEGELGMVLSADYNRDGTRVITSSTNGTAKIWDVKNNILLHTLYGHTDWVNHVDFSPDGSLVVTASCDGDSKIWDVKSGELLNTLEGHSGFIDFAVFSPNGNQVITAARDCTAKLWDVESGKLKYSLEGSSNSPDFLITNPVDNIVLMAQSNGTVMNWDVTQGNILSSLNGYKSRINIPEFTFDGKRIITYTFDENDVYIWGAYSGVMLQKLKGHTESVRSTKLSPDCTRVVTGSEDRTVRLWDADSGVQLFCLEHEWEIDKVGISPDGRLIFTYDGSAVRLWDSKNGKLITSIKQISVDLFSFSPNSNLLVTTSKGTDLSIKIWDVENGTLKYSLNEQGSPAISMMFSPDGQFMATTTWSGTVYIWETERWELLHSLVGNGKFRNSIKFSPDGLKIMATADKGIARLWDTKTGELIKDFEIKGDVESVSFKNKQFISHNNSFLHVYSLETGQLIYSFVVIDSTDYLILHPDGYYDGTEAARNLVYFVCNGEIIKLSQMKEALFVPRLVEKIMTGQKINDPKLSDLGICDALPIVTKLDGKKYRYTIRPRRLPLERAEVYVNDKLVLSYPVDQLSSTGDIYELELDEKELDKQLQIGEENRVKVIGVVKSEYGSELRTRGITEPIEKKSKGEVVPPRLFAVMIGVNDYKDPSLRLNYPVKDAKELGKAIESAATKLLGKDNVFMYPIHTEVKPGTGFTTPEKAGIKRALEDIGTKARPEDIVLMFFAGHGEMQGADGKQFTFLTADASRSEHIGISTKELQNWLSYQGPHKMLANKTILIFDACYSGQVNNDFVVQTRNEDPSDRRIKQVEDLKDKSGMFILAGSAPDQAAYELAQYQNGMLTYSLLSVLKKNPGILDDQQFLNVQKWFLESEQKLKEEVESKGLKQDARPFGTANIRIGIVDKEVRESIVLANERPAVYCANVLEFNANDDILLLKDLILKEFMAISTSGSDKSVILASSGSEQINRFNISYLVKDDDIISNIKLLKGAEILLHKDMIGKKSELTKLVKEICEEVIKHAK